MQYNSRHIPALVSIRCEVQSGGFLGRVVDSAHSGAIYQFHSVTASGVSILGEAIDAIRAKGYEFALFTGTF